MTLISRMAWVIDDGVITKVFYPVFPPDKSAERSSTGFARRGRSTMREVSAHAREHRAKHVGRQHAGVRVVARAVIAVEERQRADRVPGAMRERCGRQRCPSARSVDSCAMRPERHDRAQLRHRGDAAREEASRQVLISAGVGLFSAARNAPHW
jgi:hypothetical protein